MAVTERGWYQQRHGMQLGGFGREREREIRGGCNTFKTAQGLQSLGILESVGGAKERSRGGREAVRLTLTMVWRLASTFARSRSVVTTWRSMTARRWQR